MASQREILFAQVKTDLAAINGAGSYVNTIREVSRDLKTPDQIKSFPAIVMVEEDEPEYIAASPRDLFLDAKCTLLVYDIDQTPGTAISTKLNTLVSDVKIAMLSTTMNTHSGTCHRTAYEGMDPLAIVGSKLCGVVMRFSLRYNHTWDTP